ncbi:MAG: translation initiation factor IF-3 [Bacillota bacterium]
MNEDIKEKEVRLIDESGEQLGIVETAKALDMAYAKELDLVMISPGAKPPVCKLMDYGKFKFDTMKREKEAKKAQKSFEIKETWLSMTIDTHDLEVKAKTTEKFLKNGDKVKVSIRMKGRQMAHPEQGAIVMNRFFELLKDCSVKDKEPNRDGRNINMILSPIKDKK